MTNRQGARPPTMPRISLNIPRLHDDAPAIKHVKKLKFSSYPINQRQVARERIIRNVHPEFPFLVFIRKFYAM